MTVAAIGKLHFEHDTEAFDCGKPELNNFLRRFALSNQRANLAQTYVLCRDKTVIAYYSLAVGQANHQDAPRRITEGLGRYPVPLMVLARLAVTQSEQGRGWGSSLLKDALRRTAQAADIAGIRALFVHAKDDEARAFYEHFNFRPSPTDPYHLFLLMQPAHAPHLCPGRNGLSGRVRGCWRGVDPRRGAVACRRGIETQTRKLAAPTVKQCQQS